MTRKTTRRQFVQSTAALGLGFWVAGGVSARPSRSALEEISFGCVGIGGKGSSDSADANNLEAHGSRVVAVCDIDDDMLEKGKSKFPGAKHFHDFRKMLEEMGDSIDAVTVSTPDHTHAVAALMAMRMGKHCFCQKPLTHSIEEARMMADVARESKVVTQMGNQHTANPVLRTAAALVKAGAIGTVSEVHVWTDRPVWPQSYGLKVQEPPQPDHVHWNEWIGPARFRPYSPDYHTFKWRGFWDFGTGALGDMACHTVNMPFMALNLRNPTSVVAKTDKHDGNCYPKSSMIEFDFPELDGRPAVKLFWYDGGKKPISLLRDCPRKQDGDREVVYGSGSLLIGDKGKFFAPGDYCGELAKTGVVVDGEFTQQLRLGIKPDVVRSPGHFKEMTDAIRGNGKPVSNFDDYAGPLTETNLLGNLAVWTGERIEWDAENMVALNNDDESVRKMIRHDYLNGYSIHV